MAALLHSESSRLYSWWWDSHISPKNSKWLQENLTDMDAKVKAMIKLIEEDADSFARRAEMYYKKRPELMKLVEEFYRAYRALAERYDHATGELRQAHRTMAEAFPDQVPFLLPDDSPSGSERDRRTPAIPHPIGSFLDPDDSGTSASDKGTRKKGLKQLQAMFGGGEAQKENSKLEKEEKGRNLDDEIFKLSNENHNLKNQVLSESKRAGRAEMEIQNLKEALEKMHKEKEAVLLQYQKSMKKLSKLEGELNSAQMNSRDLDEQASKAAAEVQSLREALVRLDAERDARSFKHKEYLERISHLESVISQAQKDAQGLNERAIGAEMESRYLEKECSRLEAEKDGGLVQYKQCLEKISDLEKKLMLAQEDVKLLNERSDRAETEVRRLAKALADLNEEKNAAARQYESCLEKISKLESELSHAQEEIRCLNSVVELETEKLKSSQEKRVLLETTNKSLQLEAENLVKKIAAKDEELSKKQEEFEKIQACLQDEHLRFVQVEATLQTLQNLHSQSQEDHKALMQELKNGLQMLKDLETCKHGLEDEIRLVKDENRVLNELNSSSSISMEDLQNEITRLREMKQRLEEEVGLQMGQTNSLHQEIHHLKDNMCSLNKRYQEIIKQVESAGVNPGCIQSSLKDLQDENLKLRQTCKEDRDEKEALLKKLASVDQLLDKNAVLENSLSDLNGELKGSQEKVKSLQDSCELLLGEKSALVAEKATLLSQLQVINQNMQKLLETNAVLENSLAVANVQLEGLREKSKGLEELCKVLNNDKSVLLSERNSLIVQLDHVECRLQNLESRFAELETKYVSLEKEKESTVSEVKELKVSLGVEKEERTNFALSTVARLTCLENHVQLLQEETRRKKKEFEEELDKLVNAQFEIFILQKFIQDMEQKNYSLLIECQKHVEASKLTDRLISELESENLEQQVETELLIDEIEKLRLGIYQVFKALEIGSDKDLEDKNVNEQIFVHRVMENIEEMKCSLLSSEEDRQQLLIENSVLLALIGQLRLEGAETESEKKTLDQEFKIMTEQLLVVQNEKHELREMNKLLKLQLAQGDCRASALEAEMERLCVQQGDLQRSYLTLQDEYSQVQEENWSLLKSFSDLKEENCRAEEENDHILLEMLALQNLSVVFKGFGTEKASELKLLSKNLCNVQIVKGDLEKEVGVLRKELEKKETENLLLKHSVKMLEKELGEVKDFNCQLRQELLTGKNFLCHKETELSEVKQKLKATEDVNSELGTTLEELKMQHKESTLMKENLEKHILVLSETNMNQNKEIKCLNEVNRTLDSELGMLREEIEEYRIREEYLNSELQEISNEFGIWEAEAATFHFDLQLSNIREVLFENKVVELTGVCEILGHESASKTAEIEQMKERVGFMETEIGDLKAKLLAYSPLIDSLTDNVASLEHCVLSRPVLDITEYLEPEDVVLEVDLCEESDKELTEVQKSLIPNGIPELQKLQTRIKAVEKVMREEKKRLPIHESSNTNLKTEACSKEIEELKSNNPFGLPNDKQKGEPLSQAKVSEKSKLQKIKPKFSETRNGIIMKDIPLDHSSQGSLSGKSNRSSHGADDQMLELWETTEDSFTEPRRVGGLVCGQMEGSDRKCDTPNSELQVEKELGVDKLEVPMIITEPNQERSKRKILERLDSDAQKLKSLQATVEELRRKLDANRRKKAKKVDLETVKEQLQEVEETILELVEANGQLSKNIEEIPLNSDGMALAELEDAGNLQKKRVSEQARKGSEKIGRLQLEVQKIQYVLLKLEDEKKSKGKSIVLRNFIHGGRSSPRKKKACFCGCFRPPTTPRHSNSVNAIN